MTAVLSPASLRALRTGGLPIAVASAAAFGLAGPMAASLLNAGWSPGAVVLARLGGAALVLVVPLIVLLVRAGLPTAAQSRRVVAYGIVAIAAAQLCYFNAVQRLSVGVALLLEYLAPVLLIGWHWARSRRRPQPVVLVGAAVSMIGMVGVLDLTGDVALDPIGVAWALTAAVCLAGYFELATDDTSAAAVSPMIMTSAGLVIGAVMIMVAGWTGLLPMAFSRTDVLLASGHWPWWVPVVVLISVSAVFSYLTGIVAVRRLGSSVASFVALSEVIFAVIFAIVLVGQRPGPVQLLGGALVLGGIVLVQRSGRSPGSTIVRCVADREC